MKIREGFYEFTKKYQLPYIEKEVENVYQSCIEMNTEKGMWDGFCTIFEEDRIFVFILNMGIKIPDIKRDKVQNFLAELSNNFKIGSFLVDSELGMLICKCGQFIPQGGEAEIIERVIFACVQLSQEYFEDIILKIQN